METGTRPAPVHPHLPPDDFAEAAHALLQHDMPTTINVPGVSRDDIETLYHGIFRFDAEVPPDEQARWTINVPRDPDEAEPDDGIIRKNGKDKKLYLHVREDTEHLLNRQEVYLNSWQSEWFQAGLRVRKACIRALAEITWHLDECMPGHYFTERVLAASEQHVLRVLKYVPLEGVVAADHYDRDALTFSLGASAPGFYARHSGPGGHKMPYAIPGPPEALLFSGLQLERQTDGKIRALYHGADNHIAGAERWAIVFFSKMYGRKGVGTE